MAEISTETWREILQDAKKRIVLTDISFQTWLRPLRVSEVRNNTIVVQVTTGIMGIEYITRKFLHPLKAATKEITGTEYEISFITLTPYAR